MAFARAIRVSAAIIAISVGSGADAMAQTNGQVTFHVAGISALAPVRVVGIKIDDKNVSLDEPVAVGSQWLRDVSIQLKNVSTKTIVSGGVGLMYPETGDGSPQRPMISTPLTSGRHPDHAYLNKDGSLKPRDPSEASLAPLNIQPSGVLTLSVGAKLGDSNQATASKAAGGAITRVTIELSGFFFSDESQWFASRYFIPEPAPERYRPVSIDDFRNYMGQP